MIEETNRLLKTGIEDDEGVYTLGGWLMSELEEAVVGAEVSADDYTFVVAEMENRQIKRVGVRRAPAAASESQEASASAEHPS
ncbi:transporter associated domain-containing protein [Cohnella rhizosphaerae]|uniref:Transporter-associated domain-containing protein n=1 Tax=Cohnella rhizosphaerae TaxID=1457232 RepID=A0A9X4KVA6_9BACL|nr:transporter associated domain-containing protein [Cohnella rhizosphaerae]MDG0811535.1 hypothetical protein [Cohnella rhizosphaerae]